MKLSNERKDLFSGIFFLVFAAFLYAESYNIKMSTADALGPQFFPRMVAIAMVILAFIVIGRSLAAAKLKKARGEQEPSMSEVIKGTPLNLNLLLTIALLILHFLLVGELGFIITTALYLFGQMFLLLPKGSIKKPKFLIVVTACSIVIPAAIYLMFYHLFSIFLPAGILG